MRESRWPPPFKAKAPGTKRFTEPFSFMHIGLTGPSGPNRPRGHIMPIMPTKHKL